MTFGESHIKDSQLLGELGPVLQNYGERCIGKELAELLKSPPVK